MSAPQSRAGLRNLQANPAKFRVNAERPALVAAPVSEEESESIAALGVTVVSERERGCGSVGLGSAVGLSGDGAGLDVGGSAMASHARSESPIDNH